MMPRGSSCGASGAEIEIQDPGSSPHPKNLRVLRAIPPPFLGLDITP
jgi:hypothetical protein